MSDEKIASAETEDLNVEAQESEEGTANPRQPDSVSTVSQSQTVGVASVAEEERKEKKDPTDKTQKDIEKEQEAQLRAKYPGVKGAGSSLFLQKRLSKGTKYFDSGDYNMAKAKMGGSKQPVAAGQKLLLTNSTGDEIPTPDTVPHKKIGLTHQSKLASMS